jgi:hypothetical protein
MVRYELSVGSRGVISMLGGGGAPMLEAKRARMRRAEMAVRPMVTMRPAGKEP